MEQARISDPAILRRGNMRRTSMWVTAAMTTAIAGGSASAAVQIDVLSSKPQLVTGENALVRISGATTAPIVTVGKNDVSKSFKTDAAGNYIGVVTGLAVGNNALTVKAGADTA